MNRDALLVVLLVAYGAVLGQGAAGRVVGQTRFDPLAPRPRLVEQFIVAGRFADALPLATELHAMYPAEPLVSYWLARIEHELNQPRAEAEAWEDYVRLSNAPAEACPAWPDAYTHLGDTARARAALERCEALAHK